MRGPGKYDLICGVARESAGAECVLLVVMGGKYGGGFSVQSSEREYIERLPVLLRMVADQIEEVE
jgi:hypothetical protein